MESNKISTLQRDRLPRDRLLESWAREFQQPLLRYFRKRMSPPEDAYDLVQEVFLRLSKRADISNIERIEGYLFRTAASVLADRFRKQGRLPDHMISYEDSLHGEEELTPERVLSGKSDLAGLIEGLYSLPERTRQIFVLYHLENMRQKDIAERLGVPVSTLEKHMARANKHLLNRLGRTK